MKKTIPTWSLMNPKDAQINWRGSLQTDIRETWKRTGSRLIPMRQEVPRGH